MQKLLNFIFLCLIFSIQTIDVDFVKQNLVTKFSSDQEAQDSIDFTLCLKAIEDQEYLDLIQELIDLGELPDGDLKETALSFCQSACKTEEVQKVTQTFLPLAQKGQLLLASPSLVKNEIRIKPLERELILDPNLRLCWLLKAIRSVANFLSKLFGHIRDAIDEFEEMENELKEII